MNEQDTIIAQLQLAVISAIGHVLHRAIELEFLLEAYIARHFISDETKEEELIGLIFSPTGFI